MENLQVSFTVEEIMSLDFIETNKDIHFTEEILTNNCENEILNLEISKYVINGVSIQSKQPLNYRVLFYGSNDFNNININTEKYIGSVDLDLTQEPTFRINNENQYRLNSEDLKLQYKDFLYTNKLYISLMNLSNKSKQSGTNGEIKLIIKMTPRL